MEGTRLRGGGRLCRESRLMPGHCGGTIAHKEGKDTTIFLLDEGVYLAKEGIITHVRAATGDVADDLLAYLQAHEVPILVCTPCAKARQVGEEDLIEGARMATAAEFINMSCDAAVISL